MAKGYSARRGFSNGAGQAAQQMQMQQKLMQMQQEMAKAQQEVEEATFTGERRRRCRQRCGKRQEGDHRAHHQARGGRSRGRRDAAGPRDLRGQRGAAAGGRCDEQPHEQLHQRSEHPRSGAVSAEYSKETPPTGRRLLFFYFWLRRSPAARSVLRRKMAESVRLTSSAMGNDHHTSSSRPVRESRYATGSSTQIWRQTETIRL